jgi:small-conductance mechanosensitive channel
MKDDKRTRVSPRAMGDEESGRPLRILFRDLVLTGALATGLYVLFTIYNSEVLHGFTATDLLLFEAGSVALVAWLVARSVSAAASEVLARRGQKRHGATVRLFLNLVVAVGLTLALFKLAGVSAESIFLGSAFAGIVLGLASQTVLANVFAGLLLVVANPFQVGDRVSIVTSSYGVLAPSYPHEAVQPAYSGIVEDIGLIYTALAVDSGGSAKIPNAVMLTALLLQPRPGAARAYRFRMTFPLSVPVSEVEAVLTEVGAAVAGRGTTPPRLEVVDLAPTTWDGAVVFWSALNDETALRDKVLRTVLARVTRASPTPGADTPRPGS